MLMSFSMGIVLLRQGDQFVAQVPLLNFKTFASEQIENLIEVSDSVTHRWKFYTYTTDGDIQRWASWMRHRDLSDLISGGEMACSQIIRALLGIRHRPEHRDFQDALVDAWVSWLRTGEPAGSLGVRRLRLSGQRMCGGYLNKIRLMEALIVYHDPNAAVI